jgi:iron complex outermembrane receptor protein
VQTVRKPEAGAAGSLEEVLLTRRERGLTNSRSYDGYYPSLHVTINLTNDTLLRLAYAKTIGRPDLSNLIPNATITENDNSGQSGAFPGVINTTNTGLKPWSATSYDLSLEHYTKKGGVYSVGVFQKNIDDFWGFLPAGTVLTPELAEQYGLPDQYLGWNIISRINVGAAKVDGFEFNIQQKLDFGALPDWARGFSVNLNATQLHLTGANAADFSNFISATRNLGLTYSGKRFVAKINFNHRGRQRRFGSTTQGPDGYNYFKARTYIDINAEYQISKHLSLFGVARNINNTAQTVEAYGSTTPAHAKYQLGEEFGVQFNLGIKGTF